MNQQNALGGEGPRPPKQEHSSSVQVSVYTYNQPPPPPISPLSVRKILLSYNNDTQPCVRACVLFCYAALLLEQ